MVYIYTMARRFIFVDSMCFTANFSKIISIFCLFRDNIIQYL